MIRVRFFALVRELVGCAALELEPDYATVGALRAELASRGGKWALALEAGSVLMAVNQTLQDERCPLADGDEVAFFPPVTGG
ncbi:MAG: molybdopterin synthase sulfur carrier subunit [Aeromonadaceae bacterium]